MDTLKAQMLLVEARLPNKKSGWLKWHLFQSRVDVLLLVEKLVLSNGLHMFHNTVSLLESLTTSCMEWKEVQQEWYQSTKVGVSEVAARHMASFCVALPTVFGWVKDGDHVSTWNYLPAMKSFREWNTHDGVSGIKSYINTGIEDLSYQLHQDIGHNFGLSQHSDARLLVMEMHELPRILSWKWGVGWMHFIRSWLPPLKCLRRRHAR
jgi:hypothetical protein